MAAFDPSAKSESGSSRIVWGSFFFLSFVGALFSAIPWEASTGVLLCVAGGLMVVFPPAVRLPRLWWSLALIFVVGSLTVFLPISWLGGLPRWRQHLEDLGVSTGSRITVQAPQAFEMLLVFVATMLVGLWLAGHRSSASQIRFWALAFSVGVATYAVLSKATENWQIIPRVSEHFGFFPNRNHSGTYLAMGIVCGLGTLIQGVRDKRILPIAFSVVSLAISLWAIAEWSISRGGVVLVGIGSLAWLAILGPRYLGNQGLRAIALLGLAVVGGYVIADSRVKNRLAETAAATAAAVSDSEPLSDKSGALESLDFRVPIALDTLDLIRDSKGFGIGPAQFPYVIPQYRSRTIVVNDSKMLHPESDWLWITSENGVPAGVALLSLVLLAIAKSTRETIGGRDRAIRAGCLVAGALVAVHGFFDVPGHRIPLAWSAAYLFALSFRSPEDWRSRGPARWFFRLQGVLVIALGAWFVSGFWFGGPGSMNGIADRNDEKALSLYQEAVDKKGSINLMKIGQLNKSADLVEQTSKSVPLDQRAYGLKGRISLFFPEKFPAVTTAFRIERDLQPSWVKIPYLQGLEWAAVDPNLAVDSWTEAFSRADAVDLRAPRPKIRQRMLQLLMRLARGHPDFEAAVERAQRRS